MNYFEDTFHFRALLQELKSWKGTQYSHSGVCVKGIGSDCCLFVGAVLVNTGAISPIVWPKYVRRHGGPAMLDLMLNTLEAIPHVRRVWKIGEGPIPAAGRGWLVVISSGKAHHHLSIVGDPPQIWHCLDEVAEANFMDTSISSHVVAIYEVQKHEN